MDKETLSHYGWIVILVLILSVLLAFGTPFGKFVAQGASAVLKGYVNTNDKVLSDEYMNDLQQEWEEYLNSDNEGLGDGNGSILDGPSYDLSGKTEVGMLDGDHLEYNRSEPSTLSFRSPAAYSEFETVLVDGKEVEDSNYTVTEGSTVVTFTPEYSAVLALGNHTVDIVSATQYAKGSVRVYETGAIGFSTLTPVTWNGLDSFYGGDIWTDGTNTYYSSGEEYQYILNGTTWEAIDWGTYLNNFYGRYVWFDTTTNLWTYSQNGITKALIDGKWTGKYWYEGSSSFSSDVWANYIWTDGETYFYSNGDAHYVMTTTATGTRYTMSETRYRWDTEPYGSSNSTKFTGNYVWSDGENTYYSKGSGDQWILREDTWEKITWDGYNGISALYIWTDGTNYYYSCGTTQYVLNGNTWEAKKWDGLDSFYADGVWTDGTSYYYSTGTTHYKFS